MDGVGKDATQVFHFSPGIQQAELLKQLLLQSGGTAFTFIF